MMAISTVKRYLNLNKYLLLAALVKAAVAGAGLALAALAAMDIAIAHLAREAWEAWQVDQMISRFALVGAGVGTAWKILGLLLLR